MNSNMADMFGKFSELQSKVEEAKQELAKLEVEAEAGGGMVKVRANGQRKILGIELDKDVIDPEDAEMLEDLVVAGVNKALDKAEEAAQEKMQNTYKDMMPGGGLPGMDLSKLGM
ncbi:YbaB/EbfC family nucleoid-associated protein [Aliifodinibius salicampi]|uniref:Nucleoid-associated protein LQ318_12425 n=1 Tax=Fodinibius salicampi TaxID=1920655 RepID=A0ABT3Q0S8_9BACT|nr:YbaB/EbfC family nucleoid-associated protein [Fodinibius salicampi]MCW9713709.1 YbaB/EbfC family nucleoid-associated protein [Fodinibius salicampi]